jgi:hypothetical protein
MLFPPGPMFFNSLWKSAGAIRMGQAMAERAPWA